MYRAVGSAESCWARALCNRTAVMLNNLTLFWLNSKFNRIVLDTFQVHLSICTAPLIKGNNYVQLNKISLPGTLTRHAETPECCIIEFWLESIFSYNFGHIKTLCAIIHDLPANLTKIVCKCCIWLEF